jgi:sugar phosphate isomerase/epimerase
MKLGVITDCFKKSHFEGIKLAAELGLDGVQVYATTGEFSPETLTQENKAAYKKLLKEQGLVVSALCGDMGGHGFEIEEDNAERVEKTKKIIDLAEEFGAKVITTHIGVIPSDKANSRYQPMVSALTECGLYAKEKGITLAIETGPETAATLLQFLQDTKGGVGVNLDPANFVMVTGQDPVEAVYLLKDYIVHTHLKDGKMLKKTDPKIIYDCFADGGIEALNVADYFIETPLGEGDVDVEKYLAALQKIGYDGYLTIERETGEDPIKDITLGKNYVKQFKKIW